MSTAGPDPVFEDVNVGSRIPDLSWGRMTPVHIMRWSAAIENWHRIHYDRPFAVEHDKLPDVLINGSLKQHLLVQAVRNWVGPRGWLWYMSFRFHGMDVAGDTLVVTGLVNDRRPFEDFGVVQIALEIRNQKDEISTSGIARAALPFRNGKSVPYPFPRGLRW